MVSPISSIAVLLGSAFLVGLFRKSSYSIAQLLSLLAIAFPLFVSAQWLIYFMGNSNEAVMLYTAGAKPPFSVSLQIGLAEAFLTLAVNLLAFLSVIYLMKPFRELGAKALALMLILVMGLNVIILTRDIFNLFVFLEIVSIALIGLILLGKGKHTYSAGFKYLIAIAIISSFLLVGIAFVYYFGSTLNIDDFIAQNQVATKGLSTALFLLFIAVLLELKPFPANGWAIDLYEAAHPGVGALISGGTATASLYVLYKVLPMGADYWSDVLIWVGLISFLGSNILGISQKNANRLLGYSSIGQIGLLVAVIGFSEQLGQNFEVIFFSLFISHFLAKVGLFWLSGWVGKTELTAWSVLRTKPWLLLVFGIFLFTLIGFPPFPSFFGKWQLIVDLADGQGFSWIVLILAGSLFEGIYLFRWLGYAIKGEKSSEAKPLIDWQTALPIAIFALLIIGAGYVSNQWMPMGQSINLIPVFFILALFVLDFLPAWIKNTLSIAGLAVYGYLLYPELSDDTLRMVFAVIFLGGGILTLIAGYSVKGKRAGFFPFAMMMFAGLMGLVEANNLLQFFFAWELMTLGSYVLIIRGKRSMVHAYNYMLFSLGGAYLIFMGIAMATVGQDGISLEILRTTAFPGWTYALMAIGFLTKTAALGFHIWLPGAHAEAESDVSPMVSGILLKGGVFGLIVLFLAMGGEQAQSNPLIYVLGWLGAITALIGNLIAVFQEDAKKLLAYSSIGNLGYVLFALAFMSNVGWMTAITYSLNHFLFKTLLFLAIGGVVLRVKTHNMHEMGGLIKQMPLSFIAVLIGIITLAGIPPLSGYAGKWLFYNAVIAQGWYFQGAIVFFAGTIAFLYCFKLIYAVFLGQPKDKFRKVKEAPVWYIIPQLILIVGIMVFSARPDLILKPVGELLSGAAYFPTDPLNWENVTASTNLGYWSGYKIMLVIGVMFVVLLTWLLLMSRKAQKVKQFDIVYAGETPFTPGTTHYSHNMFAPFYKAIGFLALPMITQFWNTVNNTVHELADSARKIYSGNGQSYLVHILAYVVIVYLILF
ncbi:MAG: proton-conducting transporter membrane subunit [Bacteroidota bacterium]|nr:proton-conducting transporter membrane subunit [Bacteroidota bacterium]